MIGTTVGAARLLSSAHLRKSHTAAVINEDSPAFSGDSRWVFARDARSVATTTVPSTVPAATPKPASDPEPQQPPSPPPTRSVVTSLTDIPPSPDFLRSCSDTGYDDSAQCVNNTVAAIDNARAQEGLPGMTLPTNWTSLTPQQQSFVATNLERTVRDLSPLSAMATAVDQDAQQAAAAAQDPSVPADFPYSQWAGAWAGELGNPLEAMYLWMYDDGEGSGNLDCTPSVTWGCWKHRDTILSVMSCTPCVMGAGFAPGAYQGMPSITVLLVNTSGSPESDFTWQQEEPYL